MLIAALDLMEAPYVCPGSPVFLNNPHPHLRAYLGLLPRISKGQLSVTGLRTPSEKAGAQLLAAALNRHYPAATARLSAAELMEMLRRMQLAAAMLSQPAAQAQLSSAVAALSAGRRDGLPPLSLQHAQYTAHSRVINTASQLVEKLGGSPPSVAGMRQRAQHPHEAEAAAAARSAAEALLRLQPDHPRTLDVAIMLPAGEPLLPPLATVQQQLLGVQRAKQQGSDCWAVHLTGSAAMACTLAEPAATPAELQAVETAAQQAEAALARCKRLLPHTWVNSLQARMPFLQETLQTARLALASVQAQQTGDPVAVAAADEHYAAHLQASLSSHEQHLALMTGAVACAGCGRPAVGLRACARCRAVRYCSRECQAAHWPQHKRQCRPA